MEACWEELKTQLTPYTKQLDFVVGIICCLRDLSDVWWTLQLALHPPPLVNEVEEVSEAAFMQVMDNKEVERATPEVLALLSRTISGGRTQYGGRQLDPNALLKRFAALYASDDTRNILKLSNTTDSFIGRHGKALISVAQQVQEGGESRIFCNIAYHLASKRVLFITASGYIGLGPDKIKPGHQLCVLAGSPMPVLLSRREDHYKFIGDFYVDGLMEGEAVEASRSGLSHEGPLDLIKALPTLGDYMHSHPLATEMVLKFQEETLAAFHQQTRFLKDIEFGIR